MEEELFAADAFAAGSCGGGIMGTIDLCPTGSSAMDLTDKVHLLPCCIKKDGPCPVSHYFKPKNTGVEVDGLMVEEAFFRGRKLQGATISLPEGFRGYVLGKTGESGEEKSLEALEGNANNWESRAEFGNIKYWNHDSMPSQDDPLLRCFHWFSVANALHKPVTVEDLAFASNHQDKKVGSN